MKVLLIGKSINRGGAAIASYRLLNALREEGVNAALLVQEGAGDKESVFSTTHTVHKRTMNFLRFVLERLFFLRYEKSRQVRFLFSPANTGEELVRNKHIREADLIHLHWINGGFLSLRSLEQLLDLGKPVVWTFHDMWAMTGGCHHALDCKGYKTECGHCPYLKNPGVNDLSHGLWKKKKRLFSHRDITVVAPSRWMCDSVRESSLFGGMEVHTIPNGVDPQEFAPMEREEACRILGLDPSKKFLLFGAASIRNLYKGFGYFQEAVEQLSGDQEAVQDVEVILFGKAGREVSAALALKSHFFDYVDSIELMRALYSVAHLYVISSLQETFPTTVIESMLCGTPVVGFRTGGIPEMIDHLEDGYLAEHRSAGDLARGIRWAIYGESYEALSRLAREAAVQRFSGERSARLHMELYEKILKRPGQ
jgi:glycosyltransferase involved in cell wall biosynthesis